MPRKATGKHTFSEVERPQKNGEVYVYERECWYDPETRNTKSKFKLKGIRTRDGGTRETRGKRKGGEAAPMSVEIISNAMLAIAGKVADFSGVAGEVSKALPADKPTAAKILTLAWFIFLNDGVSWTRAENWTTRYLPLLPYSHGPITEDVYQPLFRYIGLHPEIKWSVFKERASQMGDGELIAWDSTTIACGVDGEKDGETAKDKDGLCKRVVKILYIYSITSRQLIAYEKLKGNVADLSTVRYALGQLKALSLGNVEVVQDNGYYSSQNIGEFLHQKQHFIISLRSVQK